MSEETAARRDEILAAFRRACPKPTRDDLASWSARHPNVADDLRVDVERSLAAAPRPSPEPSPDLLERTRARALEMLSEARARVSTRSAPLLTDLMAVAGTDVPQLARALDLSRAPLVDVVQGRVVLPLPAGLLRRLAEALRTTLEIVAAATAAASPSMGSAKADGVPTARRRHFRDIVGDDPTMTVDQKARWLELLEED